MTDLYPFLVLLAGVVFIVLAIIRFRVHAFIALMMATFLVGLLSWRTLPASDNPAVAAIALSMREFGNMAGSLGVIIVMASIIGKCLMDSGAADVITRRLLAVFGERRAPVALMGSGYLLSIPVFFDTVFFLLVPLAKAFCLRTGGHYLHYVMAICAGGLLTHSLVAPTPGPLIMAENLQLDLGMTIIAGVLFSIVPAIVVGIYYTRWLGKRYPIPLRDVPDTNPESMHSPVTEAAPPPFWLAIMPIVLPVALIAANSIATTLDASLRDGGTDGISATVLLILGFFGERNIALVMSAMVALFLVLRQKHNDRAGIMASLESVIGTAGIIILITSAGGAFGAMIRQAGVGEVIQRHIDPGLPGAALLLLAFLISAVMKTAQGSSTVAMITASAIMYSVIEGIALPFHPVYIFLAIGFGGLVFSWMNDSGFWVVCKMGGFTEAETLKTWTTTLALLGLVGIVQLMILSAIVPLNFLR
jgi:GntP family gluconate:H+ symporter